MVSDQNGSDSRKTKILSQRDCIKCLACMEGRLRHQLHSNTTQALPACLWQAVHRQRLHRHCSAEKRQVGNPVQEEQGNKPSHANAEPSMLDRLPADIFKARVQEDRDSNSGFRPPRLSDDTQKTLRQAQQQFGGKLAVIAFAVGACLHSCRPGGAAMLPP